MSAGVASYSKWSPTTCGSPALDWATSSRPSGRASASCAGDGRHLVGAAAAVGADRVDAGLGERRDRVAGPDAHHRAQVGVERQRRDHRQVGYDGPGGRDRRLHLAEVAHRLDQHDVDAAVAQPAQLLLEELLGVLRRHRAERLEQLAGRAEVAGDEDAVRVGDLTGRSTRRPG